MIPVIQHQVAIEDVGALLGEVFALKIKADGAFSASFSNGKGKSFAFGLDREGQFNTDRSKAGEDGFNPQYDTPLFQRTKAAWLADGATELLVVFDRSICELFADGGLYANSTLMYPTAPFEVLRVSSAAASIANL